MSRDIRSGWKLLRGKIDDQRFNVIASRFTTVKKEQQAAKTAPEPTLGAAALQDLMLQAEILVQYGMRSKAIERLQRIQELFPREEERNQELQKLYMRRESSRAYAKSAGSAAAANPAPSVSRLRRPTAASTAEANQVADVSSLAKVAEITRKLYHQGNAEGVLKAAANEIGANWRTGRCIAALRKPGCRHRACRNITWRG